MRSGFFNSTITGYDEEGMPIFDRAEDATFFAKYFSRIVGNGVFADPGDGMMVQASNGMNLVVKPGVCFINGYMGWLESDQVISVDAAHAILDRIDMIVARYDGINREIGIHYIKGTESSSPVPPDIERTDTGGSDIYDLALAQIYISKRVTTITQANITDLRLNNEVCGIVTSPIEHLDTSEVNAQLTAAFNEWFDGIKGQLSEDAAGNLQNQIDEHKADNMMHNQAGSIQVWPGSTAPEGWLLCNGQAVSRTTYANLFSVLGTTYGQGDGSTTFNVPDLTGRVPMGTNGTYPLASKGGEAAHTLSEEELPAVNGYLEFHNIYTGTNLADAKNAFSGQKINGKYRDGGSSQTGASSYAVVNLNFGQDGAHNNMQPYLAQHYIIKY